MYVMQVFRKSYESEGNIGHRLITGGTTSSVSHARNWARKLLTVIDCACFVTADADHESRSFMLVDGKLKENVKPKGGSVYSLIDGRAA